VVELADAHIHRASPLAVLLGEYRETRWLASNRGRGNGMRALLVLLILLTAAATVAAAEIRPGRIVTVKANSFWFEEFAQLEEWRARRKAGDAKAFEEYQDRVLHAREAWQFINPVKVRVIGYNAKARRVYVETVSKGRMEGVNWFLDVNTIQR
jgi:hypothetical protein